MRLPASTVPRLLAMLVDMGVIYLCSFGFLSRWFRTRDYQDAFANLREVVELAQGEIDSLPMGFDHLMLNISLSRAQGVLLDRGYVFVHLTTKADQQQSVAPVSTAGSYGLSVVVAPKEDKEP